MGEHRKLAGDWESVSHKNLDLFLKKLGTPVFLRQNAAQMKLSQKISFSGYTMKVITVQNSKINKKVIPLDGSNFRDEIFQKVYTATAMIGGDGSIKIQGKMAESEASITILRRIDKSGRMRVISVLDGVECVRVFVK